MDVMTPAHLTPDSRGPAGVSARRAGRLLFLSLTVFYVFTAGGSLTTTDAVVTYELTKQMVERGTIALPGNMLGNEAHRGRDGRYYSPFGIAQSVYNVPFFLAARAAERVGHVRLGARESLTKAAVALGNTVAMAGAVWLVYVFAARLTGSARAGMTSAVLAALATPLWPYSKFGFNAPLSALFVTAAAYCAWRSTRDDRGGLAAWSGAWTGLALLTRHELLVIAIPITGYLWLESRNAATFARRMMLFAAGVMPAAGVWLGYNAVRFGQPLDSGYMHDPIPGFGSSIVVGLYGLLLSPTASLFVYCPLAIVALAAVIRLRQQDRSTALLLGGVFCTLLLFYAQLGNWMGGRSYGPRYLVPAVPLLCVALAPWFSGRRLSRSLAVAAVVSGVLQLPGVLVDYAKVSVAHARADGAPTREDRLFDWGTSPLMLNTRAALVLVPKNVAWLAGSEPRPPAVTAERVQRGEFSQQFSNSLDFWWLYLFHMRVLPNGGVGIVVVTFVLVLTVLRTLLRGRMREVR